VRDSEHEAIHGVCYDPPLMTGKSKSPGPADPDLEGLVERCLRDLEEHGPDALERLCKQHPARAAGLRNRIECLRRAGLVVGDGADLRVHRGSETTPMTIGPYRILGLLGEGGMGVVYLAHQEEPIRREVAIKIIKLGMDTKEVLHRFELERQALAAMNHPHVARVLDAGITDDGRPYFAMEHVPGTPITDYCDEHRLGIRERLELFSQVCNGVQHAHLNGVIHRDIKPSNVLVQIIDGEDGEPVAKIIDFGIAKATDQRLTEHSLFTEQGKLLGTPEYMSPEQAEGAGRRIDTRTDIYSLGVLLYELLAGVLPFQPSQLRAAGYAELQRLIREVEPPRPSTRVTTKANAVDSAQRRSTNPSGLAHALRQDLDWVTLKALEKDPARRYQNASELAADIQRYLKGLPVEACPPSAWYRTSKFVHRYRWQVSAAALLLLSLIGGTIGTTWFMFEAWAQEKTARERAGEAEREKAHAQAAAEKARVARALAESRLTDFDRLSAVVKLREAKALAAAMFPAWPDKADELRRWLDERGRPLVAQREPLRRALEELRRHALPYTDERRQQDIATHPKASELARKRAQRARTLGRAQTEPGAFRQLQGQLDREIATLEEELAARRTWLFLEGRDQFLHDTLAGLVADLGEFEAHEVQDVSLRLAWATSIRRRSIDQHEDDWRRATAAIAKSDGVTASRLYKGLRIQPQLGLVPIGMDPDSRLWEFAHVRSGRPAARSPGDRRLRFDGDTGLVFVLIPGGEFLMGAQRRDRAQPNFDPQASQVNAEPVHRVVLDPFLISKYEMSQGQWLRLTGQNPSAYHPGQRVPGPDITLAHPVECVSWETCTDVLRQHGLDLPTEAQWEYACRAGTNTVWWTGDKTQDLRGAINCLDQTRRRFGRQLLMQVDSGLPFADGFVLHAPVHTLRANPWGLHHVHGNVCEWCRDNWARYILPVAPGDGLRDAPVSQYRVSRGGSYYHTARLARSAARPRPNQEYAGGDTGCRPSRRLLR